MNHVFKKKSLFSFSSIQIKATKEQHLYEGNRLFDLKRDKEALNSYNEYIKQDSNYALAHFRKGCILSSMNEEEEALSSYNKAI